MIKAFIFDMDGVLIDSNPTHKLALQKFCEAHGHELTEEQLREKVYGRMNRVVKNSFCRYTPERRFRYAERRSTRS